MGGNKQVPERRPRHPTKELEVLLRAAEAHGWRVVRARKYYEAYCPCDDLHIKVVHLTPSGRMYATNLRGWFERQACWQEGHDEP